MGEEGEEQQEKLGKIAPCTQRLICLIKEDIVSPSRRGRRKRSLNPSSSAALIIINFLFSPQNFKLTFPPRQKKDSMCRKLFFVPDPSESRSRERENKIVNSKFLVFARTSIRRDDKTISLSFRKKRNDGNQVKGFIFSDSPPRSQTASCSGRPSWVWPCYFWRQKRVQKQFIFKRTFYLLLFCLRNQLSPPSFRRERLLLRLWRRR